jgi:hypothetical protein
MECQDAFTIFPNILQLDDTFRRSEAFLQTAAFVVSPTWACLNFEHGE